MDGPFLGWFTVKSKGDLFGVLRDIDINGQIRLFNLLLFRQLWVDWRCRFHLSIRGGRLRHSQRSAQDTVHTDEEPVRCWVSGVFEVTIESAYSFESGTSKPDLTRAPSMRIETTSFNSSSDSRSFSSSSEGSCLTRFNKPSMSGEFGLISNIFCFLMNSA
jgi:hypothetical protein